MPVYRTFPGFEMRVPLPATDPEGDELICEVPALPEGATLESANQTVTWVPSPLQIGPFSIPFTCWDSAQPPAAVNGELLVKVLPRDACTVPECDPLHGCETAVLGLDRNCCMAEAEPRISEPVAQCPAGRVMFLGRNDSGFGRLQNCDVLRMYVQLQTGAHIRFHVEARCLNTAHPVALRARLESASRGVLLDVTAPRLVLQPRPDGFAERRHIAMAIGGAGPFFDLENAEANFSVTVTDADAVSVSNTVRVILTSTPHPDLPEADPTPVSP